MARIFFKKAYGNSTIEPTEPVTCDRSRDIAPPGGWPPTVLPSALNNADRLGQEIKLSVDQGVIYQAKLAS